MCGITGIFSLDGATPDAELLRAMNDTQVHRGPDGSGVHVEPGAGLAHRRLAIIDLEGGLQPLANEDGTVIVTFNGEIYNFQAIATELAERGHVFRTHSDTEVIVHAWEEWGPACLDRFNGMFAFAIWDRRQQCMFLARDRLGKKPLYYGWVGNSLLFSSELKALLRHPDLRREVDPLAIEEYFAFGYVPDPRTIFKGVAKLPPGHYLWLRRGSRSTVPVQYWDVHFQEPVRPLGEAEAIDELRERLREATRRRMIADVPLGAFLSGGVDSSAIVAQMASISSSPVKTCSIGFDRPDFDESRYAALVAERFGTDHVSRIVGAEDFGLVDSLPSIYDEPFADSSALPTLRVCGLARERVTVALSGDAGDECFAGYRRYEWHMREQALRDAVPLGLRRMVFGPLGRLYPKLDWAPRAFRAKTTFQALARDSVDAYLHTVSVMAEPVRRELFTAKLASELQGHTAREVFNAHVPNYPGDALSLVQYLDFKTYLPGDILVKVDRASMKHSLEVRCPMLDFEFVSWATTLPRALKLKGGEGKYVLKKAMEGTLPDEVLYRRKMGFAVPLAHWFRNALRERVGQELLSGPLAQSEWINPAVVRRLWEEHQSGRRDHSTPLWSLLSFSRSLGHLGLG